MHARISVLRALASIPTAKAHIGGKRKLKRNQ
jgi:hypothetical protein